MLSHAVDVASEVLIADLLEEDLRALIKEGIQQGQGHSSECSAEPTDQSTGDFAIALAVLAADVRMSSDAAYAQSLQHSDDTASVASRQYAQQLCATEKRIALDVEFARRLQRLEDTGKIKAGDDLQDIEAVLGKRDIDQILAENPIEKGKGKAKALVLLDDPPEVRPAKRLKLAEDDEPGASDAELEPQQFIPLHPTCGICFEEFQLVHSPINAANIHAAASSSKLPFGITMPCPAAHPYCHACLLQYIKSKIDPMGDGTGSPDVIVFPILCPECPLAVWETGITDEIANRICSEQDMILWRHQELLDSVPRFYCPNKRCSAPIPNNVINPKEVHIQCAVCDAAICVSCQALWHENLSCEAYQALPPDERSPEDLQTLQLMRTNKWRRCPQCKFIVELTHGCNHIRCRCGTQFCFKCGAKWDARKKKCGRSNPSCDMWDEDMLLAEEERQRHEALHPALPHNIPHPPGQAYQRPPDTGTRDLRWMMTPDAFQTDQTFTRSMVTTFSCGYCPAGLRSLWDLRYHLNHIKRHAVHACCGRFYENVDELEAHLRANVVHRDTVYR